MGLFGRSVASAAEVLEVTRNAVRKSIVHHRIRVWPNVSLPELRGLVARKQAKGGMLHPSRAAALERQTYMVSLMEWALLNPSATELPSCFLQDAPPAASAEADEADAVDSPATPSKRKRQVVERLLSLREMLPAFGMTTEQAIEALGVTKHVLWLSMAHEGLPRWPTTSRERLREIVANHVKKGSKDPHKVMLLRQRREVLRVWDMLEPPVVGVVAREGLDILCASFTCRIPKLPDPSGAYSKDDDTSSSQMLS